MSWMTSDRLMYRPFWQDDFRLLYELWQHSDVMQYLPGGKPRSAGETEKELKDTIKHWKTFGFGVWALFLKETEEFAGYCGIRYQTSCQDPELLYAITPDLQGSGGFLLTTLISNYQMIRNGFIPCMYPCCENTYHSFQKCDKGLWY